MATEVTREELEEAYLRAFAAQDKEGMEVIGRELAKIKRPPSVAQDVAMSAASGYSGALWDLMAGGLAAKAGISPEKATSAVRSLFGDYTPETRAGGYAKRIGAGASFGPGGVPAALAGAAGGALSQFAAEQGYGPVVETAAFLVPGLTAGAFRAMHTRAAARDLQEVLEQMSPQERIATGLTLKQAAERGVPLGIWQAAPLGSTLHEAGAGTVTRPGAMNMQELLRQQVGMGDQAWVKEQTGEAFKRLTETPVSKRLVERIARAIERVGEKRRLDPASMKEVQKAAELFGKKVPGDQKAFVDSILEELKTAPPNKRWELVTKAAEAASGKLKAPLVFEPQVKNVGEIISAKGRIKPGSQSFPDMAQGTRALIRKEIDVKLRPIPGYVETLKDYEATKKIAEIVARDQKYRGKHAIAVPEQEGRLTAEAAIPYALATNPWWASVPFFRKIAGEKVARELDEAFASRSFEAIRRIAAKNPQLEGAVIAMVQLHKGRSVVPPMELEQTIREYLPGGNR